MTDPPPADPGPVEVRDARESDLPAILDIYNDAILHTTAVYDYEPHTLEMRAHWFRQKREAGLPVLVAAARDLVLGFASYGPFRSWAAYRLSVENSVYVRAAHRGRGLGAKLLGPLLGRARDAGLHAVLAGIDADNEASLRLHRRFGFVEVAHFKEVGYKFDRWLDLKFLERILDRPRADRPT